MPARICVKYKDSDGNIISGKNYLPGKECLKWSRNFLKEGGKVSNPLFKGRKSSKKHAKDYSAGGKYSVGGMLVGPSHEEGGIQVIVDGTEPIEVEGGEFVINKKTVDSVGEDFLHKLNHTSTPYHDSATGFSQGILPSPSNYKGGGKLKRKMQEGGTLDNRRRLHPKSKIKKIEKRRVVKYSTGKSSGCSMYNGDRPSCVTVMGCNWDYSNDICR